MPQRYRTCCSSAKGPFQRHPARRRGLVQKRGEGLNFAKDTAFAGFTGFMMIHAAICAELSEVLTMELFAGVPLTDLEGAGPIECACLPPRAALPLRRLEIRRSPRPGIRQYSRNPEQTLINALNAPPSRICCRVLPYVSPRDL